jgi:thioredoxin reductase (NADPH)
VARNYDVIIIGGGPAGLTAGLYAARARLSTLLIERAIPGGQIVNAELVENYPGFPEGISGYELGQLMHVQAAKFGLETLAAEVTSLGLGDKLKVVKTTEGDFAARALIIASGSELNKLGVPGEKEFTAKGVSYCATCDGALFKDQVVAVVGGGNAAIEEALFLTRFASKVIVIHRRRELRATKVLQERAFANPKMEFLWDTVVEAIKGDESVKGLEVRDVRTGEASSLEVSGIFIYAGFHPNTDFLKGFLTLDAAGNIPVNEQMETEIPGVFAAGDLRRNSPRQVVTAVGDGATAALSAERYLSG